MLEHLKEAKAKYNVKTIEFHTYGDETQFPQNWYNRLWFKKDDELIIMSGDVWNILNNLGSNSLSFSRKMLTRDVNLNIVVVKIKEILNTKWLIIWNL